MKQERKLHPTRFSRQFSPVLEAARDGWGTTSRFALLLFAGRVLPGLVAIGALVTIRACMAAAGT